MTCGPCPPLLLLRLEQIRDTPKLATVHVRNSSVTMPTHVWHVTVSFQKMLFPTCVNVCEYK